MTKLIPLALAMTCALLADAAFGQQFTYRGQLDDGGAPAEGRYDLRVQLFVDRAGMHPLAAPVELHGVQVSGGEFAVALDVGELPAQLQSGWIEVAVKAEDDGDYWLLPDKASVALKGALCPAAWELAGNAGTSAASNFLGTSDSQALVLRVNNQRALRIEPHVTSPRLLGGHPSNSMTEVAGATIGGGGTNTQPNAVSSSYGTISGGRGNSVSGLLSTIGGGEDNLAPGAYNTIGGGRGNLTGVVVDATIGGGASNRATGQTSTVGGGFDNIASALTSTIGGGLTNRASADDATIAGGRSNQASGTAASIGGGNGNLASGINASIGGGFSNQATNTNATVGGGSSNRARGFGNVIAGGFDNQTRGQYSTVGGGSGNCAAGDYNWVAGRRAKVAVPLGTADGPCTLQHDALANSGVFVWADGNNHDFVAIGSNSFQARATGGFRMVSAVDASTGNPTAGTRLDAGTSSWTSLSDRASKTDIVSLDAGMVLARVVDMPMYFWRWKADPEGRRHIGPMAQDFHAAFGLNGDDDRHIVTIDGIGVALAAVQGLNARLESENAELRQDNHALAARLTVLETRQQAELAALREELALLRELVAPAVAGGAR
ncbi:MAG TPA: tail fiber domain-containing protein [Xanthomonadaceae bacterium]|nr:tail fiber domain-containing protein [Xanthomonadaceae bacterium]